MVARADIIAGLRASMAAIEQGSACDTGVADGRSDSLPATSAAQPSSPGPEGQIHVASCESGCAESGKTADEAFRKILRWVSVRERSTAYVRERLAKDEFPTEAIEGALDRAVRTRAVDDRRYSDALIRMKLSAGKGLRAVEAEISELGIDPASLDAWQEHASRGSEAEVERALAMLRRRPPRAKQAREAAFRKLVGQGYTADVASTAARRWFEELRDESSEQCFR